MQNICMTESNRRKLTIRRPPPSEFINFSPASSTSHQICKISEWLKLTGEKSKGIAQRSTKSSLTLSTDCKRLSCYRSVYCRVSRTRSWSARSPSARATTGLGVVALRGPPLSWVVVSKVITAPTDPPDDFKVIDRAVGQVATPRR